MQSFKSCRRRHWYEYEIGLRKEVDAKALRMGSAGHDALDLLKQGKTIEEAITKLVEIYQYCPDNVDRYDWDIEYTTVETLVIGWDWRWQESGLKVLETEQAFEIPLVNPATGKPSRLWKHAGKIDGIIDVDDRLMVFEHKFISDDIDQNSDYWRRLQLDSQVSLYVHAARKLGHDVESVLYDCIRKPTIKPNAIPLLDDNKMKIVLDEAGERVFNKVKAKKSCNICGGASEEDGAPDCLCRIGKPRQTGDKERGWVLQSRPMTPDEWSKKLLDDIVARPEFYYARNEIARLDSDINEVLREMWEIQKTMREAQQSDSWYRTVNFNTCTYCSFFGICSSKLEAGEVPEGFNILENVHPELGSE